MQVQVIHRLAAVFPGVNYDTIAFSETALHRNLSRHPKKMT